MLDDFKRVLVTGGCGFIGQHLVDALVSRDKEVLIIDNLSSNLALPRDASVMDADIRDYHQLERTMRGTDLVFHVAANASGTLSITDPRHDFEVNSFGTFNVVQGALSVGARRVVYLSSASVYGRPQRFPMDEEHHLRPFMPYGASKLAGELTCLTFHNTFGRPCVIGRPFCVYGPGENPRTALVEVSRYLRWHLNGKPIQIVGSMDDKTRDFIHVNDLVASVLLLADRAQPGDIFNLGSGEECSMRELVELIGRVTGRSPIIEEISDVREDTYRLVADTSRLKGLGFASRTTLSEGVSDLVTQLGDTPELPVGATIFRPGQRSDE